MLQSDWPRQHSGAVHGMLAIVTRPSSLDGLAHETKVYFGAPATRRTYQSTHHHYLDFCSGINVRPLPIMQSTLCLFATQQASQSVSYKSIKGYLSALRYLQIAADGSEPGISGIAMLGYILLGIKRVQEMTGACAPRPRLTITAAIMSVLKRSWEAHGALFKHQMLWAAYCTCFHGFLHSREATVPTQAAYDPAIHLLIATSPLTHQSRERSLSTSTLPRPISLGRGLTYSWEGRTTSCAP